MTLRLFNSGAARGAKTTVLSETDVRGRLEKLEKIVGKREVITKLYEFGQMLVQYNSDHSKQLEAKATTMIGYAGAVLGLLVYKFPDWANARLEYNEQLMILCAGIAALVSAASGFAALIAVRLPWFSDREWLKDGVLDDLDTQTSYYVLALFRTNQAQARIIATKGWAVLVSQLALFIALLLLSAAVICILSRSVSMSANV